VSKLRELERRLQAEPESLSLRVTLAGALHEAGRTAEAVALYRSVAAAYRAQGREQQAAAVCRSLLEIAPADPESLAQIAAATAPLGATAPRGEPGAGEAISDGVVAAIGEPFDDDAESRRAPVDLTPLPAAVPYHVADPTQRLAVSGLAAAEARARGGARAPRRRAGSGPDRAAGGDRAGADGEAGGGGGGGGGEATGDSDDGDDGEPPTRPGSGELTRPEPTGIASAARRISAQLIAARVDFDELSEDARTAERRGASDAADALDAPEALDLTDDAERTRVRPRLAARGVPPPDGVDEERTLPHGGGGRARAATPAGVTAAAMDFACFAPIPEERRAAVIARFSRRQVPAGTTLIRRGALAPALVVVARGELAIYGEGPGGAPIAIAQLGPGEHAGEGALLARALAPADVVAVAETELLVLAARDFYALVGAYPGLWGALRDAAERRAREHAARLAAVTGR
jgi:hypothetical protein